jgi:hypothetical protein
MSAAKSPKPKVETVNLCGDTDASILLMNALAAAFPRRDDPRFAKIAEAHRATPDRQLEVTFTVAGVTIPLTAALEELFTVRTDALNRLASERAEEMVSAAALTPLTEALRDADWKIREALVKVGAEFRED